MAVSPRTRIELYFTARFEREPQGMVFVPGRIVLLGEHVDHQGGSILATVHERGIYVAWGVRPDHNVALHALNVKAVDKFSHGSATRSGRRFGDLARGLSVHLAGEGRRLPGLDLAVFGDLPARAGLASSAAYASAILTAFLAATGEAVEPAYAARLVAAVEREWAGVACGFMDPYVVLAGAPGEVVHLDTRALTHETLPLPPHTKLEHQATGIERSLDASPYNQRREELGRALAEIRALVPDLASLVDLDLARFAGVEEQLSEPGRRRARHVVTEMDRVRQGVDALRNEDAVRLGALMHECHESLTHDFECSLPAIDTQVEAIAGDDDVLGVRLQGAGWGGSLAVLRRDA